MPEILLVRHGETDWNRDRRVQGHTDTPLNGTGIEQARALAAVLATETLAAVYSSDLVRARDTAVIATGGHGLEVRVDSDLREKNFGTWEGLTPEEIERRFPGATRGAWGDAETSEDVTRRAFAAITGYRVAHPAGRILVVSHGGPLRCVIQHLGLAHGPIDNCALIRVTY